MYRNIVKPGMDIILALILLIGLSPVILFTALLLSISNNGKIWFTQIRPGKNGKPFRLIKFKTMTDDINGSGELLSDANRLTKTGMWVRKFSLDELPQMLNIIQGNMSFIGPRPLLMEYLPLYNEFQKRRHEVKPGITGWAQVNGRNEVEWLKRFEYDVWYVDHLSFPLDLKIVFLTIGKVFKAKGITSRTSATMEKFRGNE